MDRILTTLRRPSFPAALVVTIAVIGVMAILRLNLFGDRLLPVAYGVPLVLCLYLGDRRLLWLMASGFAAITVFKFTYGLQSEPDAAQHRWLAMSLVLLDTLVITLIVHLLLVARCALEERNAKLEVANSRLVERDAAIEARNKELHAQAGELDERRREAEEASVLKTRFLAAVSHDIRTPVNAINVLAELILRGTSQPSADLDVPAIARELKGSTLSLVELVSDALDVARFDSGKLDLQPGRFTLRGLLEEVVLRMSPLARARGLPIELAGVPDLWLLTDRVKFLRILTNLIGNAIKFTDSGHVRLGARQDNSGALRVQVSDTGVGIASDQLDKIFDEFYQLQNPERDRTKGTGLGLAICKRMVLALGGEITVSSAVGHGSVFEVRLPPSVVTSGDFGPDDPRHKFAVGGPAMLRGLRILLVEDHPATRRATARLLMAEGAHVTEASNGREALHMLGPDGPQFDVVLLDLMLPDMDGRDVLVALRHPGRVAISRVFALTGDVSDARRNEVIALGAHALIPKPVDIPALLTLLGKVDPERMPA